MLMVVDVGNTNMVFGVYDNADRLIGSFRLMTGSTRTSDEIGLAIWQYFQRFGLAADAVEDVVICSVVPGVMHALTNAIVKYFGCTPLVINEDMRTGLKFVPGCQWEAHGADRSVACVAALEKYGAPLIVLDFGTATTVDAMNRAGICLGGAILAGMQISMEALFHNAAKLPQVELGLPESVLGKTGIAQIQAGVVGGYVGATEYLISRTKAEMEEPDSEIRVVATGGLARMVAAHTKLIDVVDGELILEGLVSLYHRCRGK